MLEYTQPELELGITKAEEQSIPNDKGSNISPSALETIIHYQTLYSKLKEERNIPNEILEKEFISLLNSNPSFNKEEELNNAKDAIVGTHLHNLTYYQILFHRCSYLGRLPTIKDFEKTFPFRNEEYYESMNKVLGIALKNEDIENPTENALTFWNSMRFLGQDYKRKNREFRIPSRTIKNLWEGALVEKRDIERIRKNINDEKDIYDPRKVFIMNEVPLILNTYFNNLNFKIITSIDEIRIDPSSPTPIHIVDYKTGSQFKEPGEVEKLQIFLMMLAVYTRFVDKIHDLNFEISDWEIKKNEIEIYELKFKKKNELKKKKNISSIQAYQIPDLLLEKYMKFSYVDPVSRKEIYVNLEDEKINSNRSEQLLQSYCSKMDRLHRFYLEFKSKGMRAQINGSRDFFCLPRFPSKEFLAPNPEMFNK